MGKTGDASVIKGGYNQPPVETVSQIPPGQDEL
jgi:hypothetical protein